jgi:acyl-CoA thioester hydrolase
MPAYHFYHPIQVRYSDCDPQGHVNNARFVSFIEEARFQYIVKLGLWEGGSFLDLNLIVASIHMDLLAPINLFQPVRVGARVTRIGNKSIAFEYLIEDSRSGQALARAETAMVTYDYHTLKSIPVPDDWREKIAAFEGIPIRG